MFQKLKNQYHLGQAAIAKITHKVNHPLIFIGITGTDGKTTTSLLLHKILQDAGFKSAVISTIGAYIGDKFYDTGFHTTTPSPFALRKYIKMAANAGCTHIIIETTSHALDQNRIWGIPFEIGIITNITSEHLDYHKTYESYAKAKAKLLKIAKHAVINEDDKSYETLTTLIDKNKTYPYSLYDKSAYVSALSLPKTMKLIGEFNKQNALAAASAAKLLGIPDAMVKKSITEFTPPAGRQEVVHSDDFKVVVDFAHTPASFEKVLPEIKKETKGRLIHIFGAAGKRDPYKRPHMGNASSKYADVVILTSEDPRGEDVALINTHIRAGFQRDSEVYEIENRKKAIQKALAIVKKGDTILITGKGHEMSMNMDGKHETPWNDKEIITELLSKKA